jgi:hypothetical protein
MTLAPWMHDLIYANLHYEYVTTLDSCFLKGDGSDRKELKSEIVAVGAPDAIPADWRVKLA